MRRHLFISALALGFSLVAADAAAVIGRPLTPVSYAGVARRTTRRAVRRTAYVAGAATAPVVTVAPVATLPPNCQPTSTGEYVCGTTTYRQYYQGTSVVYAPYP